MFVIGTIFFFKLISDEQAPTSAVPANCSMQPLVPEVPTRMSPTTTSLLVVGVAVPIPTFPFPNIVIFSVKALSVMPVNPAVAVKKCKAEVPSPVEIPDFKVKSPPAKSAVPAIAPPEDTVNPCPAVAAVVFLSIQIVRADVPPRERS